MSRAIPTLLLLGACALRGPAAPVEPLTWKEKGYHSSSGSLSFRKAKASQLRFELALVNSLNDERCDFEGSAAPVIVDSDYEWRDPEASCSLRFRFLPGEVSLAAAPDCQAYCGLGTSLPDAFYERPAGCAPAKVEERRRKIKKLHHQGIYLGAADAFSNLLATCGHFMDLTATNTVLHDKAFALWKYGDSKGCRDTLAPLAHWVGREHDTSHNELPAVKKLRREITYTWKLCGLEQ